MNNSHYTVCVIFVALLAGAYKHNTTIPGLLQIPLTVSEGELLISEIQCRLKVPHMCMENMAQRDVLANIAGGKTKCCVLNLLHFLCMSINNFSCAEYPQIFVPC